MTSRNGLPDDDGEPLELDWKDRAPREEGAAPPPEKVEILAGKGMPGEARYMSIELKTVLEPLFQGSSLTVRQLVELGEVLTGWETRNKYEVFDSSGRAFIEVTETGGGFVDSFLRNFWGFRKIRLEFMTYGGILAMAVTKPFTWFFKRFDIESWDGRPMFALQQRFSLLNRRYDVLTQGGATVATIEGPLFHPWTFLVKKGEAVLATIRKQWGGIGLEAMTDADIFGVELTPQLTDPRLRQMVLGATLAIDLAYFENRNRNRSHHHRGASLLGSLFD